MSTDEEVLAAIRAQAPADAPADEVEEEVEEETPEEADEPGTPDAGDEADATDLREQALAERERKLEETRLNMERGFQRKMQKLSDEIKTVRAKAKPEREVAFLAEKMIENPAFAQDMTALAAQHGIRMPDVTLDDIEERVQAAVGRVLEKMEEKEEEKAAQSYRQVLDSEADRLQKTHRLKPNEVDDIFKIAADPDNPLLRGGMTPKQIRYQLDLAAASYLLPRAKTIGQRSLLSRAKDKSRSAAALASSAAPPPPPRASSFNEDDDVALRNIRASMKR